MVYVERGEFVMGDELWEDIDGPRHKVVLTEDYYVSKYELTRDVWYAVMADSAVEQDARHPITNVSFIDALQFVEKINHFANMVKQFVPLAFSLPTEAQWEYAARGGRYEAYAGGENANNVAYWRGNSQNGTHPVGSLSPNSRELYDMSGNVGEWCLDGEMEPYSGRTETDPLHEEGGDRRVIRGGSYASDLDDLRVGHREHFKADQNSDVIGIRLIMKKQL
jgi:formylglycine-generating enzyme required for sulfatase activity